MTHDIVTQLRIQAEVVNGEKYHTISGGLHLDAADEIELLRRALDLSVGELSTNDKYQHLSPEQLRSQFLEEARRG